MFGQHLAPHRTSRPEAARRPDADLARVGEDAAPSAWPHPRAKRALTPFTLRSPAFADGAFMPEIYAEASNVSPPLAWDAPPAGAQSFALTLTDPDVPPELGFPRAFAHWMVADIPVEARELPEGASGTRGMPREAREFASDFVTLRVPGYGRGYGGPWPPDDAHRYVFTLYALKTERVEVDDSADYVEFVRAVLPFTITTATLVGLYGPARASLPQLT